ncbi:MULTISPECIES: DUF896 domain-containing protein [Staphylococcus]|uniref:DUF896 domain-containing protein n=1 Tax=Staphylococcus TaxID=1279 RepID=UPI000D0234F5|nr:MULTISPECIES: DUF896 domain-containing protein [Staphylococcus]MCD8914769.1 DUF896 domain-containing protein [Staphylococcus simulans]UXV34017.1 DUF896 domain-containing protein [Staphylococcus sp. IVB6181]
MADQHKETINRINELSKKKKAEGLTKEEAKERAELHQKYLETFREGFKQQIENTKVLDPEGNDVTPEKLKQVQREQNKRK